MSAHRRFALTLPKPCYVDSNPALIAWAAAASAVIAALDEPPSDIHGSADYRRHLAGVMTERALALATQRAEGNR